MSRYAFPSDPSNDVIDLTDERPFYFNEYSGELSLEFPKAERLFKGGILASVIALHWSPRFELNVRFSDGVISHTSVSQHDLIRSSISIFLQKVCSSHSYYPLTLLILRSGNGQDHHAQRAHTDGSWS